MKLLTVFLFATVSLWSQSIYEDFACSNATGAVDNGDGTATITCPGAHGFVASSTILLISGATGDWIGLNTQSWTNSPFSVTSSQTRMLFSDLHRLTTSGNPSALVGRIMWDSEIMQVTSCDTNTYCTVVRGVDGTTAAAHTIPPQGVPNGNLYVNYSNVPSYLVTATPTASTFKVTFNCATSAGHTCAAFSGTLEIRRYANYQGTLTPTVSANPGAETWGLWDEWKNGTIVVHVPDCPDQTNLNQCVHGVLLPENQKGYDVYHQGITKIVVDASHNGTVTLSAPFVYSDPANQGFGSFGLHSFVFVRGMNEGTSPFQSLNYMFSVAGCNGTVGSCSGTINSVILSMPNATPGTYMPSGTGYLISPVLARFYAIMYVNGPSTNYPSEMLWSWNKSGTWNPLNNRLCNYLTPSKTANVFGTGGNNPPGSLAADWQWGTYPNTGGTTGSYHFYHNLNFDTEANQPMLLCENAAPSQFVGDFGNDWPNDNTHIGWQIYAPYDNVPGSGRHYFDALPTQYFNGFYQMGSGTISPLIWSLATNEPEEVVRGKAMFYSAANSKYNIYVEGPKSTVIAGKFEFRYSTASMKANGYSTGICTSNNSRPGTSPCPTADQVPVAVSSFASVKFTSGTVANPPGTVYWAIKPIGYGIYSTTGSGQNPTYVITEQDLGFQVGDHITVASVPGNTAANVTAQAITAVQPRQFWFLKSPLDRASAGPLTSIVSDGTTCTVNLTVNHNIFPGWVVSVYGTGNGGPWTTSFETFYKVATTPTARSFTFACPGTTTGTYNSDADSSHTMSVESLPGVGYAAGGSGLYAGDSRSINVGGTITSNEDTRNFTELVFSPTSSVSVFSPCDINKDGVVNATDVSLAVSSALGTRSCDCDLDGDGACNVLDVQRIVAAALGGTCRTN